MGASFESFASERGDDLLRRAFALTGDRHEAQDVVQEALLGALERWDRVSAADDPYAYVRRIEVNANVSRWCRTQQHKVPRPVIELADTVDDSSEAHAPWHACLALARQQRIAVILRYYEGMSYYGIGQAVGCSEATARSRVSRALGGFRSDWREGLL